MQPEPRGGGGEGEAMRAQGRRYHGQWAWRMRARKGKWAHQVSLASLGKDFGFIVRWSLRKALFPLFFFLFCM